MTTGRHPRAGAALMALAVGAFAIGTGEFAVMGILPGIATNLSVSIPAAGHLISAYALGVVVGAPVLVALSTRLSRRTTLIVLMGAFAVGNGLSAVAPGYHWLLAARFLAGLPHGAYFGVGAVVAGGLVEPSRRARATASMFAGLTIANVIGVPLSTLAGQHLGWRVVFAGVGVVGAVASVSVLLALPRESQQEAGLDLRAELRAIGRPQVWLALLVATLGGATLFTTYSYIVPMLTRVTGFAPGGVTWLLVVFGLGMTAGNYLGARLADRVLMPSLYTFLVLEGVVAAVFLLTLHNRIAAAVTLFVFAATTFALVPVLQTRIITQADGAPNIASAAIQAAFNVANALGAWLGGLVIAAGLGYAAPNAVAAALAGCGLLVAAAAGLLDRRGGGGAGRPTLPVAGHVPARRGRGQSAEAGGEPGRVGCAER
ncbi:MFS transporter [Streptacidiphilus albus]|uniref:MFS transporter n=1 Tax=Streptacidiphilus albus TaxID=105425 RepID=UPI0009DCDEE0|nr:MFS transporter [Streptacidiphilus albus]